MFGRGNFVETFLIWKTYVLKPGLVQEIYRNKELGEKINFKAQTSK
jgi:hypothetical protein